MTFTVTISSEAAIRGISNLKAWCVTDVTGTSISEGDVFTMHISKTWERFRITELVSNQRVVWRLIDGSIESLEQKDELSGTRVIPMAKTLNDRYGNDLTSLYFMLGVHPDVIACAINTI